MLILIVWLVSRVLVLYTLTSMHHQLFKLYKGYAKSYPKLGMTVEEFKRFLIEHQHVRIYISYINVQIVLANCSTCTSTKSHTCTYVGIPCGTIISTYFELFQWNPKDASDERCKELICHYDYYHKAFKKYMAKEKGEDFQIMLCLFSFTGFLRWLKLFFCYIQLICVLLQFFAE